MSHTSCKPLMQLLVSNAKKSPLEGSLIMYASLGFSYHKEKGESLPPSPQSAEDFYIAPEIRDMRDRAEQSLLMVW